MMKNESTPILDLKTGLETIAEQVIKQANIMQQECMDSNPPAKPGDTTEPNA